MRIDGAVALVTGANRGIGRAFVEGLLARGATKVYAGARDPKSVEVTDPRIVPVALDVTDHAQVAQLAATADDVTIVVNNAGVVAGPSLLEGSLAGARQEFEVNTLGTWAVAKAFAPVLAAHGGGVLVNMLSVASWLAIDAAPGYAASKAAQWSISNSLRLGLRGQGTHVLNVHCGYVDTEFSKAVPFEKITAATVAEEALDGLTAGAEEVLVDEISKAVKAALPNDLATLYSVSHDQAIQRRW
ncbi:SDR family oxidoreductase [Crossiella cryophila]|uniref:NAD(P)-dependent dehydrogenase (Short-subunit alcohol dehydrogenase family) n=1 Tax=Crossiella cryophila TaxID=43355 RepID=A0A7W7FUQ3_9PSEU|nr:SDR family oxidoreductase [Crossiella cryophila]MBB4678275.1 NAD(P)-dependent dehydrogenase (short-subunit alcohol dehydrogenase family) [Crossiella cryophila]